MENKFWKKIQVKQESGLTAVWLKQYPPVVSIVDDIVVHGGTEEQHDDNMRKLMERAHENGLIFNPDKCSLKPESVMFFGCLYDKKGIRPDLAKVEAIQAMPAPTCQHELQEFIGVVTYPSKFI